MTALSPNVFSEGENLAECCALSVCTGSYARMAVMSTSEFRDPAFAANREVPVHRWVPWIAGFSRHFIADALDRYTNDHKELVLDPFAGVGTTLVESDLAGHDTLGFEINPYAAFAAQLKLHAHRVSADLVRSTAKRLLTYRRPKTKLKPPEGFRTREEFYSPKVERKVLRILEFSTEQEDERVRDLVRLAFAATMVDYSNYSYEPSLGRKSAAGRPNVEDYPVDRRIAAKLRDMASDIEWYRSRRKRSARPDGKVHVNSFLEAYRNIAQNSVDLLVTSPPYANNYHYNRNTRPQLYWLGYCHSPKSMKPLEEKNFGTYWQLARGKKRVSLHYSICDREILETIEEIRRRNCSRGAYGGSGWANYVTTYLNDCVRFSDGMRWCLRPGATALVVIGNSIVQGVPFPTDRFFARIAEVRGLDVVGIHYPREKRVGNSIVNSSVRCGTGASERLYEAVVELRQS